jgi:hypothetical protein
LTYLEAEDRAELVELVDSGAKQLALGMNNSGDNVTATIQSDGYTVKLVGSATYSNLAFARFTATKTATYTFAIEASGTFDRISIWDETAGVGGVGSLYATGNIDIELTAGHSYTMFHYMPTKSTAVSINATIKFLVCTKAAFDVSQKFVTYCKLSKIVANLTKTITTSATLDATGLQYTFSADASKYYRVTAWAKANGKNPETIAIATTSDALLGYSAFPTDTTNACISTSCVINTGSSATIDVKVKYNGVGSNHYVGMIVEEL